jgi:hypothetical protein
MRVRCECDGLRNLNANASHLRISHYVFKGTTLNPTSGKDKITVVVGVDSSTTLQENLVDIKQHHIPAQDFSDQVQLSSAFLMKSPAQLR